MHKNIHSYLGRILQIMKFEKSGNIPVRLTVACIVAMMSLLTGCLQPKETVAPVTSAASWFAGATSAQNIGGYPTSIKINWVRADRSVTGYKIFSLRPNVVTGNNEWKEVGDVDANQTDFKDTQDLLDGKVYTYKVQAVDALTGAVDGNDKQVSTVTYYGIGGVVINGKNSATVSLSGLAGAFDAIHIYATPKKNGAARILMATVKGTPDQVIITGLRSGVNYNFSANAYMSFLGAEDGNVRTISGQTWSDSFGSGLTSDTNYYYRGVLNVQGYGHAPNATTGPTERQFNLNWLPFSNATNSTTYKVIRSTSTAVDTTVSTACSAATQTSCLVCTVTGAQKCSDTNVGPAPQMYYYAITVEKTDASGVKYTEELPCQNSSVNCSAADFLVTAHVPPDYMVLVQRDGANYEMCLNINAASDPRHKQRCIYYGLGAAPSTTGPSKPVRTYENGYYDFGYNLFVDRYRTACNWTRNSPTCGPNGCVGILSDLTTVSPPAPSVGVVGNVFFGLQSNNYWYSEPLCFIKTNSGGWTGVNKDLNSLTSSEIAAAVTVDPGPAGSRHKPALTQLSPLGASRICGAQTTEYGNKRLMRRREFIVSTPLPYIQGEENSFAGSLFAFSVPYNTLCSPSYTKPATLLDMLAPTNSVGYMNGYNSYSSLMPFFVGADATKSCISRFGIQDPMVIERTGIIFSDMFIRTNGTTLPPTVRAVTSPFDPGNSDNGSFSFDGNLGAGFSFLYGASVGYYHQMRTNWTEGGVTQYACNGNKNISSFIPPLGLPVCTWSGGNQTLRSVADYEMTGALGTGPMNGGATSVHGLVNPTAGMTTYYMTSGLGGRFAYGLVRSNSVNVISNSICAVEAE